MTLSDNNKNNKKKLFCFGYGYCADALARELQKHGDWQIAGTTRDRHKKQELRENGIEGYQFDYDHPLGDPIHALRDTTHLLISTPPYSDGGPAFMAHANDIIRSTSIEWIGYLSSTSVYGDREGEWVDETSEVKPTSIRGSRRAAAEQQWYSLFRSKDMPVHIFRLSGIYGPGRSAIDSVRANVAKRVDKPGQAFNRIHIDDITQILMASIKAPSPGAIYNVCDDDPAPSHKVVEHACKLLQCEPPPLISFFEADLAPIAMSFYNENKRVKNDKIKEELGITLKYPDYRAGLEACLKESS